MKLSEEKSEIVVVVKDNGIGMDTETQSHIFDKFYQGDTSRKAQGNGLGLAICKEIVRKCEGEIMVISTPGEGSEFVVTLKKGKGTGDIGL